MQMSQNNQYISEDHEDKDNNKSVQDRKKTKGKKKIRRKGPGGVSKNYFTEETQDAIIQYQNMKEGSEKDKLYINKILPAFDSLVENLINVYGFKALYDSKEDLKEECLEFLFTVVNKFDASKGSKAFSYFNVVAKNWLTIKSKQDSKRMKSNISLDDQDSMSMTDFQVIEEYNMLPSNDEVISKQEMINILHSILHALQEKVKTDNEKLVLDAIYEIVNNLDDIEILTKRAVLLYIRNLTGLSSKKLSVCLSNLKKHYKDLEERKQLYHD